MTKNEQIKILKRTENSKSDSQSNFVDLEDNSDNISKIIEIEEEEVIDCSQLSIINVTSVVKGNEQCKNYEVKIEND